MEPIFFLCWHIQFIATFNWQFSSLRLDFIYFYSKVCYFIASGCQDSLWHFEKKTYGLGRGGDFGRRCWGEYIYISRRKWRSDGGNYLRNNETLLNLRSSRNTITIAKLGRMKTAGHISFYREVRNAYRILMCKPQRNSHLEDLGVNRRWIIRVYRFFKRVYEDCVLVSCGSG